MSAVSSLSNSASAAYAAQLAQASALKRSLANLGTAVQNGDLASAGSILTAFIKANPQYASSSASGESQSQDPINQDFQALAGAISGNQPETAKTAWAQVKSDLAKDGVTDLSTGPAATAELLAQNQSSFTQELLDDTFGSSSSDATSIATLLGGSAESSGTAGLSNSLISNWLTYQATGTTTPSTSANGSTTGANLDSVS